MVPTTTRAAPRPRHRSASVASACGSPARATCWPSSPSCAASSMTRGCSSPSDCCPGSTLPKVIGIVTGRGSAAEADLLAGLRRRGWAGRAIFAHPPVQDRHAAPKISRALADLAAIDEVEVILIARGGGSLADLWAFCDETLCRTVAMLRVPVISAVGHESDRTLLDDVAAVCCSTPTHATEEAVRVDVGLARGRIAAAGGRLARGAAAAGPSRARNLATVARTLGHHTDGQRRNLHQKVREMRASSARRSGPGWAGERSPSPRPRPQAQRRPARHRGLAAVPGRQRRDVAPSAARGDELAGGGPGAPRADAGRPRARPRPRARLRDRHRSGGRCRQLRRARPAGIPRARPLRR